MKTLRNIENDTDTSQDIDTDSLVSGIFDDLRESAVEWVKESKKILIYVIPKRKEQFTAKYIDDKPMLEDKILPLEREEIRLQETIKWIKYYFNLTEEDLK